MASLAEPQGSLARGAAIITVATALSRITGFVRVMVVAAAMGTTFLANTYQTANTAPNVVFELVAAGVLTSVFVPTFVDYLVRGRQDEGWQAANALTTESRIPAPVIEGALQLKQLRSNIELLHYDSVNGLSYQDGRNWRGYFGAGADMEVKLAVYETLVANLMARGIHPSIINVVNKDAPYYRR